MSWIRLDDQIAHHPKFVRSGPVASWFWLCSLGYCQKFLTDGYISSKALPTVASGISRPLYYAKILLSVGLFDKPTDGRDGYLIHDYLDFNASREEAAEHKQRLHTVRSEAGHKGAKTRWQTDSKHDGKLLIAKNSPIPSHPIDPSLDPDNKIRVNPSQSASLTSAVKSNGNGNGTHGRSKRPIFSGQRFVVFDWMLEDLIRTLGSHTEAFDLHSWFFDLDSAAQKTDLVIDRKQQWPWLQAALLEEAAKRGLPIAVVTPQSSKPDTLTQRMAAMRDKYKTS